LERLRRYLMTGTVNTPREAEVLKNVSKSMELGSIWNYMACKDFEIFKVQKELQTQFSNCGLHLTTVSIRCTDLC